MNLIKELELSGNKKIQLNLMKKKKFEEEWENKKKLRI